MKKILISLILLISLTVISIFASGWHNANQILPGTFQAGDYFFEGNIGIGTENPSSTVYINKTQTSPEEIIIDNFVSEYIISPSDNMTLLSTENWNRSRSAILANTYAPTTNSNSISSLIGIQSDGGNYGTGDIFILKGLETFGHQSGNSNIDYLMSAAFYSQVDAGTVGELKGADTWTGIYGGSVTTLYGNSIYLDIDGGTVTNKYTLSLSGSGTASSNNYGIYQHSGSGDKNYFSGRIGIGSTNPSRRLSIVDNGLGLDRITTNVLGFYTNNAERMRIAATTGHVGIGTTTTTYRLQLPNTADEGGRGMANDWLTYSSIKYKENIISINGTEARNKIMGLNPVTFEWKENKKKNIGFIAEEVQKIIPEAVALKENEVEGLSMNQIISYLTKLTQEQEKEIQELKKIVCKNNPDETIC